MKNSAELSQHLVCPTSRPASIHYGMYIPQHKNFSYGQLLIYIYSRSSYLNQCVLITYSSEALCLTKNAPVSKFITDNKAV